MTGYESVTKAAEEANSEFRARGISRAIFAAIIVGAVFYIIVIAAVGFVAPWRTLTGAPFMTAVAFEHAVGSRWIVSVILSAALLSLFKVFNGNFVAASRFLFAMGRRGLVDERDWPACIRGIKPHPRRSSGLGLPRRVHISRQRDSGSGLRGRIGCLRYGMVRGLRRLFVYEAPNRR
jgi:amino acid transporter